MKVVYCHFCGDIYTPIVGEQRKCYCGSSWAKARASEKIGDCLILEIGGSSVPIAVDINQLRQSTRGWLFDKRTSFISCYTIDTTQEHNDVTEAFEYSLKG